MPESGSGGAGFLDPSSSAGFNWKLLDPLTGNLKAIDFVSTLKINVGGSDVKFGMPIIVPGGSGGQVSGQLAVPFFIGLADGINKLILTPSGAIKFQSVSGGSSFTLKQAVTNIMALDNAPSPGLAATLITQSFTPSTPPTTILVGVGVTAAQLAAGVVTIDYSIIETVSGNTWTTGTLYPSGNNDTSIGMYSLLFPSTSAAALTLTLKVTPSAPVAITYRGNKTFLSILETA